MSRYGDAVLIATCLLIGLVVLWPLDLSVSALHGLDSRLVGRGLSWHPVPRDATLNFIAFLPIGLVAMGLARWPVRRTAGLALLFGLGLELVQVWMPGRVVSPYDPAFNLVGGLTGGLIAGAGPAGLRWLAQRRVAPILPLLLGLGLAAAAYVLLQAGFAGLGAWSPGHPIQIANEATGDRPWHGRVTEFEIRVNRRVWTRDSFDFAERCGAGAAIGPCEGMPWLQAPPPEELIAAVRSHGRFSLRVSATPTRALQTGPARILSISSDPDSRNLTIGQEGRDLIVRIRRRWAGADGERPYYRIDDVFSVGRSVEIMVEAGSDSTVIRAGGHRLVDRHDVAHEWWVLLRARHEWKRDRLGWLASLPFWALLVGPVGLITGAAAAGRSWSVRALARTCAASALATWLLLRVTGVPVAVDAAVWMVVAVTGPAALTRRRLLPGSRPTGRDGL